MNHLSIEVHPDADRWFIILMINSRIITIRFECY